MKIAEGSYPHPVVGNADDVSSTFAPTLYASNDRRTLTLEFEELRADNPTIVELVQSGEASYVARVDCDSTSFRASYRLRGPRHSIEIPLYHLHNRVELELCAIALKPITDYAPEGTHPDYDGQTFDVQPGELLAVTERFAFELGTEWDPLRAPMQSLMQIMRGSEEPGPMDVDFDADKLIIRLCAPDFDRYRIRKGDSVDLIHAAIVLPVLVAAVAKLRETDYQGQLWYDRLKALLVDRDISNDEPIRTAQELLKLPVHRGLLGLDQLCDRGSDHD